MNQLLLIDPQNDFCDIPKAYCPAIGDGAFAVEPALPVLGAHADMLRVASLIERASDALDAIFVTIDSHYRFDIGHPAFWQRHDGSSVEPFTEVTANDVRSGLIRPRRAELEERVVRYLAALEATGRYRHMVWPVHCVVGTWGQSIHYAVQQACSRWEESSARNIDAVFKGRNPYTEQYSAIKAEIPDPADSDTQENVRLIGMLKGADRIYIAGEASSHCVKATTEHILEHFDQTERARLVLLTDCMSPVAGFENTQNEFFTAMSQLGLGLTTADAALSQICGK